jgi:hypothetical protein
VEDGKVLDVDIGLVRRRPPRRGLHSFPFPLNLSLLCPCPLT